MSLVEHHSLPVHAQQRRVHARKLGAQPIHGDEHHVPTRREDARRHAVERRERVVALTRAGRLRTPTLRPRRSRRRRRSLPVGALGTRTVPSLSLDAEQPSIGVGVLAVDRERSRGVVSLRVDGADDAHGRSVRRARRCERDLFQPMRDEHGRQHDERGAGQPHLGALDAASAVERDGLVERFGVEGERDVGVVVRVVVLVVAARLASRRRRVFRGGNPHPVLPRGSVRARHESEGVQHRQRLLGEVAVEPPLRQQERVVGGDRAGASSIHEYELARLLHRRRAHRASSGRQRRLEVRDVALRRRALRRRARGGRAERSESLGRSRFVHVRRRFDFDFFLLVGARRRLREPRTEPRRRRRRKISAPVHLAVAHERRAALPPFRGGIDALERRAFHGGEVSHGRARPRPLTPPPFLRVPRGAHFPV